MPEGAPLHCCFPCGPREGQNPHLCTVALSLLRGHDEVSHDHKGAVPLKVKGRTKMEQGWDNSTENPDTAWQALGAHLAPSSLHIP
jgi:hypothetical protein